MNVSAPCGSCASAVMRPQTLERAQAASTQTRSSLDLTVYTAEGDKVVLSGSTETSEASFDYRSMARGERARLTGQSRSVSTQFSVTVEGDLNREEMADIAKLLRNLGNANQRVVKGDTDGAVRLATRLASLDSLASVQYAFDYERLEQSESALRRNWQS